ncbi:MAG: J domain-containing protein [Rhodoferax sp.]|jgi:hypothetical protein|nr:J domain-containing protein [Rhodoferax sp.]
MNEATDALHFSDAHARVREQLLGARTQVLCAVSGPCARPLFDLLLGCRRRGLALTVVVPGDAQDTAPGIAWERLAAAGAALHWLVPSAPLLETSVCVIDETVVLCGDLARLGPVPHPQTTGVLSQTNGVLAARCAQGLSDFILAYAQGPDAIEPGQGAGSARAATDTAGAVGLALHPPQPGAAAWQNELLLAHTLAMQADIAEMHRTLNAFDLEQDAHIGDLLRQCMDAKRLHLQRLHAQTGSDEVYAQAREAQERFDQYTQAQDAKPAPKTALDPEAQAQMKQLYRKLAMRLHPDRVEAQDKAEAQALFQHLQTSYENNDFSALQVLQQQVLQAAGFSAQGGVVGLSASPPSGQRVALQARLAQQQRERAAIVGSATWQTLSTQSNWAVWFAQQAHYLRAELERYERAMQAAPAAPAAVHAP